MGEQIIFVPEHIFSLDRPDRGVWLWALLHTIHFGLMYTDDALT